MKKSKTVERAMSAVFTVCGAAALIFVTVITLFLTVSGLPAIRKIGFFKFIFGTVWKPTAQSPLYGILPFILSSVWSTIGAIILGVPVGIMCAVFIAKFAPKRVRAVLKGAVELLAGIPSVVYGLVGMIVIVPAVREVFSLPDGQSVFGNYSACGDDTAVCNKRFGNGDKLSAQGIRGRLACTGRYKDGNGV